MNKAEEKALKACPIKIAERDGYDENLRERNGYVKGYRQAEKDLTNKARLSSGWDGFYYGQGYKQAKKDLELTWEDIRDICSIQYIVLNEYNDYDEPSSSILYQEVLKRFKESKDVK